MNRFWTFILLGLLLSLTDVGCAQKTAIDQLTKEDPVDALVIPKQKKKNKASRIKKSFQKATKEKKEPLELEALKKLKSAPRQFVVITGDKVPLRKGPGVKFRKRGLASKGDEFRFLREVRQSRKSPIWYLVEDKNRNKFFLPKLFADIKTKEPEDRKPPTKMGKKGALLKANGETVRQSNQLNPEIVRHVNDPTPPLPKELKKAKHITLNFEGTDIYEVITTFAELLKLDYMIEGNVQGKVTLQTFNQIPVQDLFSVFEQILAVSQVAVVKSGNFYRFVPTPDAPRKPLSIYYGNDPQRPTKDRVVIQIIPLRYVSNSAMRQVLTPLLSGTATMLDVPDTRNLMLIDLASNVNKIMNVIQAIDIDKLAASDIRLFEMKHSDASIVTEELEEIFTSMGYKKALGESLTFLPITRLNSLLVVNSIDEVMETVEFWVAKLDQPMSGGNLSTFVYYVQNAEAATLAGVLNSIFAEEKSKQKDKKKQTAAAKAKKEKNKKKSNINPRTGAPSATPLKVNGGLKTQVEGDLIIIPDPDTNSLVVRTAAKNYPGVLELIKKLDLLPQQVVIEVMILDLTIDEQTRTGLEWALRRDENGRTMAGGTNGTAAGTLLGSALGQAATPLFAAGSSFFIGKPDRLIALLQAFANDAKANVVANPILVTSDNKEATISITDDIPIQSSTIQSPTAGQPLTQTTIEFRSVGVKLGILPKINSDNFVNLKINQEISNRGPDVGSTPSFSTRVVNTEVVLKDNQILVMGGLMRTNTNETVTGVPLLKDIPYLGRLFSTTDETIKKTELMLFITPHIISNSDDSQSITDHFRRRLGNLGKKFREKEMGS